MTQQVEEIRINVMEGDEYVAVHPETNTTMVKVGDRSLAEVLNTLGSEITVQVDGESLTVTEAITRIVQALK